MCWQAEVFELERSDRDIRDFYLGVVPWKRVSAAKQFWPAQKKYSYKPSMHASGTKRTGIPTELLELLPGGGGCGGPPEEEPPSEIEIKSLWSEFLTICEGGGSASTLGAASGGPSSSSSAPGPVAPPPPPAFADGKGRGRGSGSGRGRGENKYCQYQVADEHGVVIGHLLYNANAKSMDMHCHLHHDCAIGRSVVPFEAPNFDRATPMQQAKGRCLGFLVAWLRWGKKFDGLDARNGHMNARFARDADAPLGNGTSHERLSARRYVQSEARFDPLRLIERQRRSGEPLEPLGKL